MCTFVYCFCLYDQGFLGCFLHSLQGHARWWILVIIALIYLSVPFHLLLQVSWCCRPWLWMSVTMAKRETGSTSPVVRQIDKQFLVCSICLDHYHSPKVLPCLHTFCERYPILYFCWLWQGVWVRRWLVIHHNTLHRDSPQTKAQTGVGKYTVKPII